MILGQDADAAHVKAFGLDRRMLGRDLGQADVVLLGHDPLLNPLVGARLERDRGPRALFEEPGDDPRQERGGKAGQAGDPEVPGAPVADVLGDLVDVIQTGDRPLDLAEQELRLGRRLQAAAPAPEQGKVQVLLQAGDQTADGGLRDAQHLRRLGHAAGQHDRAKRLELPIPHVLRLSFLVLRIRRRRLAAAPAI